MHKRIMLLTLALAACSASPSVDEAPDGGTCAEERSVLVGPTVGEVMTCDESTATWQRVGDQWCYVEYCCTYSGGAVSCGYVVRTCGRF